MRMSRRNRAAIPPGTCRRFRRSTTPPKFPYAAALTPPDQGAFIDLKLGGRLRWTCPRPDRAEKECDRLSREATRLWRTATHPHNLLTDIRSAARPDSNVRRSETQRANARLKERRVEGEHHDLDSPRTFRDRGVCAGEVDRRQDTTASTSIPIRVRSTQRRHHGSSGIEQQPQARAAARFLPAGPSALGVRKQVRRPWRTVPRHRLRRWHPDRGRSGPLNTHRQSSAS